MTPLTLAEIRATINTANLAMVAALLRDLDWMILDGFDVRPAPAEGLDRPETVALKRLEEARARSVHGPDCDADLRRD
ncbi:MAG: hypothetical protein KKE65_01960, partial [Actinobacteria bacterium]|nr:hypothetical protein [Actinomycetota bacterium]